MANKEEKKSLFEEAVKATPDIASGFSSGLQALGKNSSAVKAENNRNITGSVDIDATTKSLYPQEPRWDYAVGYKNHAYFVEIHPANTCNVSEMIRKRDWLEKWLDTSAPELKAIKADVPYYWVPSGKVNILKNSPQYRQISQKHILVVKRVELEDR